MNLYTHGNLYLAGCHSAGDLKFLPRTCQQAELAARRCNHHQHGVALAQNNGTMAKGVPSDFLHIIAGIQSPLGCSSRCIKKAYHAWQERGADEAAVWRPAQEFCTFRQAVHASLRADVPHLTLPKCIFSVHDSSKPAPRQHMPVCQESTQTASTCQLSTSLH